MIFIANQECCCEISQFKSISHDVRALSFIIMKLMQKYAKKGGTIRVNDIYYWHINSDTVGFLSVMTSADFAANLLKVLHTLHLLLHLYKIHTLTFTASAPEPFVAEEITH